MYMHVVKHKPSWNLFVLEQLTLKVFFVQLVPLGWILHKMEYKITMKEPYKWYPEGSVVCAYVLRSGANVMALLTAKFCTYDHHSWITCKRQISALAVLAHRCLVTWSMQVHKPKFPAKLWNTLEVSKEFPASISADSLLTVSIAVKLGPDNWSKLIFHLSIVDTQHIQTNNNKS